jgi:hypothetical protein
MSFVHRKLKSTFVLGTGNFGEQGQNQLELSGLRTTSDVIYAGGLGVGTLDLAIYGMTLSHMNQLSTLGMVYTQIRRNSITLEAGDDENGMATVFQGTILNAWPDMNGMPNVPFRVSASVMMVNAIAPSKTISIKGGADAATMLFGLATQMKVKFENNGVNVKLQNAYYAGTAFEQAQQIVQHAGIEWNGAQNGTLAIWNPGQGRGSTSILISKDTGLVRYPTATSNGIALSVLWNPSIGLGTKIKVKTSLALNSGTGEFTVYGLDHHLDEDVPNGRWFSDIKAAPPGLGPFTP